MIDFLFLSVILWIADLSLHKSSDFVRVSSLKKTQIFIHFGSNVDFALIIKIQTLERRIKSAVFRLD